MRQFVIPQFIDVETKIIGPITVRQFLVMLVDGLFIFLTYKFCDFALFAIIGFFEFIIGAIIAFLKINGRPVHYFLINFLETVRKPKLKIWYKSWSDSELKSFIGTAKEETPHEIIAKKEFVSRSRLSEISLIVDTGGAYKGEEGKQF